MSQPFFTIGHATRTLDQFVELLMESRIGMVVDVRSMPASRIIADYLLARGEEVFHILGRRDVQPATLTPGAHVLSGGERIEYRAEQPA